MEHFQHLASIGTHSLSYALRGITRQPGSPLIIVMTGVTSSALEWSAVCRNLESEASILLYERSGYGRSEESPHEPDSLTIVDELSKLLKSAALEPPYLVVGHSWGGILAREFIASRQIQDIYGLVLVDAVQERMIFGSFPDPSVSAVQGGLDYYEVTGITKSHQLTESEWSDFVAEEDSDKHARQAELELPFLQISRPVISQKQQLIPHKNILQGRPLAVLKGNCARDYKLMYEAGEAKGQGSVAQRATYRDYLSKFDKADDEFQREFLNLSSLNRYSVTTKSGHNIQLTEPELVANEIRWVVKNGLEIIA
ncbi:hypothetical protein N7456_002269 [Penicillium angulare]|uniref:AB hydrolase-1 domain-containing protein n=1 Tax=Penicillium angulare TaxID=116970 RepID=A0A9W9G8T8_9EURO|nr:hypothetical protein N7456_002269 [Penicillium angulare]